jgi:hypothetical protein
MTDTPQAETPQPKQKPPNIMDKARAAVAKNSSDEPKDVERRAAKKRAQTQDATDLLRLIAPMAGARIVAGGERGRIHTRSDEASAFLEVVLDERFTAKARINGVMHDEVRYKAGKEVSASYRLWREDGVYHVKAPNGMTRQFATLDQVEDVMAVSVAAILED